MILQDAEAGIAFSSREDLQICNLLIVVDKLLLGFDTIFAPYLYLDK
jgi:type I site-specific restriction-modification system R (restriction) subunit